MPSETVTYSELRHYLDRIEDEHGYVRALDQGTGEDRRGTRIGRLFVEPTLTSAYASPDVEPKNWSDPQLLIDALRANETLAILGDPGSGKSTIASWIAHMLAESGPNLYKKELGGRIPVPIVLRDLKLDVSVTWEGLLDAFLSQPLAESLRKDDRLSRLLEEGRVYLLIDGFDEVSSVEVRRAVSYALSVGQTRFAGKGNHWLVTSRIVGYADAPFRRAFESESLHGQGFDAVSKLITEGYSDSKAVFKKARRVAKATIGTSFIDQFLAQAEKQIASGENQHEVGHQASLSTLASLFLPPETAALYVAPFTGQAVARFARNWYAVREPGEARARREADEFLSALARREDLTELARSPQILTMMCLVHRVYTELPDGRAELYGRVADAYLQNIPRQRNLDVPYPVETSKRWLARIGFEMQRQRTDSGEMDEEGTEGILVGLDDLTHWLEDEAARGGVATLEINRFVDFVSTRGGLLLPRGPESFAFLHLSFQEFFAALYLAESELWLPSDPLMEGLLTHEGKFPPLFQREQLANWATKAAWNETYRLLFQVLIPALAARAALTMLTRLEELYFQDVYSHERRRAGSRDLGMLLGAVVIDPCAHLPDAVREAVRRRLILLEVENQKAIIARPSNEHLILGVIVPLCDLISGSVNPSPDSSPMSELKALPGLNLRGDRVSDLTPLAELEGLMWLRLSGAAVSDIAPLAGILGLKKLWVDGTAVSDLTPLANLRGLTTLRLDDTVVSDLSPLAGLTELTMLTLDGTAVSDVSPLAGLAGLATLWLDDTVVSDLSPLAGLTELTMLTLQNTPITDLTPLAGLAGLTTLWLNDTAVSDFSPLAGLAGLMELRLDGTAVSDLSPLAGLAGLTELWLDGTAVSDLSPLAGLTELAELRISSTAVSDAEVDRLRQALPNLLIYR